MLMIAVPCIVPGDIFIIAIWCNASILFRFSWRDLSIYSVAVSPFPVFRITLNDIIMPTLLSSIDLVIFPFELTLFFSQSWLVTPFRGHFACLRFLARGCFVLHPILHSLCC
jgi:hypothetical protein